MVLSGVSVRAVLPAVMPVAAAAAEAAAGKVLAGTVAARDVIGDPAAAGVHDRADDAGFGAGPIGKARFAGARWTREDACGIDAAGRCSVRAQTFSSRDADQRAERGFSASAKEAAPRCPACELLAELSEQPLACPHLSLIDTDGIHGPP